MLGWHSRAVLCGLRAVEVGLVKVGEKNILKTVAQANMKITLDHNCIINLDRQTAIGSQVKSIIENKNNQCFVINIGASEMREKGIIPEHYELFEELLTTLQIAHLPRLDPMLLLDVTFLDRCVLANNAMIDLANNIESVLFGNSPPIDATQILKDPVVHRKWLNQICDIHAMWCHIYYGNNIFLTTDKNFTKETKLTKLLELGAGRICHPLELIPQ
jgi:hypothetical protein